MMHIDLMDCLIDAFIVSVDMSVCVNDHFIPQSGQMPVTIADGQCRHSIGMFPSDRQKKRNAGCVYSPSNSFTVGSGIDVFLDTCSGVMFSLMSRLTNVFNASPISIKCLSGSKNRIVL